MKNKVVMYVDPPSVPRAGMRGNSLLSAPEVAIIAASQTPLRQNDRAPKLLQLSARNPGLLILRQQQPAAILRDYDLLTSQIDKNFARERLAYGGRFVMKVSLRT